VKILRIELKNLNSLYGDHTVDLAGELGEVPLFLIRGPTGAGKSTIMDAVALALFGVTPRLTRGIGKADEDPRLIMSRGEWQAAARVEVMLGQVGAEQRYRATWQCHRSRKKPDGNLQEPKRILERWDPAMGEAGEAGEAGGWEILASSAKKKDWEDPFHEALEGLTVKDFQRMILLAQGEFAAFLRANEEERGEILERLTDTSRFREVGRRVNRKRQVAWRRKEHISSELKGLELLSPEDEQQVKDDLAAALAEEAERLKQSKQARRWADWRDEQAKLKKLAGAAEAKLPGLEDERTRLEADQAELTADEEAAQKKLKAARDALDKKEPEIKLARQLRERQAQADEELGRAKKAREAAAVTEGEKAKAAQGLEPTELTPEQIQEQQEALRVEGEAVGEAERLGARQKELKKEDAEAGKRIAGIKSRLLSRTAQKVNLARAEEELRASLLDLEGRLRELEWIRRLASERDQLQEGKECPLCGSTEHPLMGEGGLEQVELRWQERQEEKAALDAESARINKETTALKAAMAADARDHETAMELREKLGPRLDEMCARQGELLSQLGLKQMDELPARREAHDAAQKVLDLQARSAAAHLELRLAREGLQKADNELARRKQAALSAREQAGQALGGKDPDQVEAALKQQVEGADRCREGLVNKLKTCAVALEKVRTSQKETGEQLARLKEELTGAWERLGEDLAALGGAGPDELREALPDDILQPRVAELEEQARVLSKRTGELRGKLEEQERRLKKSEALASQRDEAEQEHQLWLRLHKLIGERDGEAFRRFAQTLNLAELVGKANAHLTRLSDRYRLMAARDPDGEPLLAFQVRDLYQAGEPRGLTTLSGGETFLISLALALALADYGSARMPVETLLLDEGFGTLDGETLQVAMNALRNLNARGTQVGIISHVEALREAIPACVEVKKLGGGRSSVEVRPEG